MTLIGVLLSSTGVFAVLATVAIALLRPTLETYIKARITAGVDEAVKRRLASFQLDLDKELEVHRSQLASSAEGLRASLARETSDYAIYALRRHEAVANLFTDFLRSEILATDFRDLANHPDRKNDQVTRVIKARDDAYEAYYRHALYLPDEVDQKANAVRESFHDLLVEYQAPNDTPHVSTGAAIRKLRGSMTDLMHIAREELSRARPQG